MPIKSFRGLIADEGIDQVSLHTNTGSTGYRIVKMEVFPEKPGVVSQESCIKIFSIPQTGTPDSTVDFSDNTLLATGFVSNDTSLEARGLINANRVVVFDNMVFNQDIYITHHDGLTGENCNYYIELETVSLDLNENTVATLKDIRNIASQ
jgi:hypothetical protein